MIIVADSSPLHYLILLGEADLDELMRRELVLHAAEPSIGQPGFPHAQGRIHALGTATQISFLTARQRCGHDRLVLDEAALEELLQLRSDDHGTVRVLVGVLIVVILVIFLRRIEGL